MADQQLGEFQSQVLKDERTYAVPTASGGAAIVKYFDDGSIPGASTTVATGAFVFSWSLTTAHYIDKGLSPLAASGLATVQFGIAGLAGAVTFETGPGAIAVNIGVNKAFEKAADYLIDHPDKGPFNPPNLSGVSGYSNEGPVRPSTSANAGIGAMSPSDLIDGRGSAPPTVNQFRDMIYGGGYAQHAPGPGSHGTTPGNTGKGGGISPGVSDPALHGSTTTNSHGSDPTNNSNGTVKGSPTTPTTSHPNVHTSNPNPTSQPTTTSHPNVHTSNPNPTSHPSTTSHPNVHTSNPSNGSSGGSHSSGGGWSRGSGGRRPIILDLAGTGITINEVTRSNTFIDSNGDGKLHRTAWAGVGSGVLFFDPTGTGAITQKNQYVFTEWDPTAKGDLEALRNVFDSNGDGKLDASDAKFALFKGKRPVSNAERFCALTIS